MEQFLDFLREDNISEKQERLLREKIERIRGLKIGKLLGLGEGSKSSNVPLTGYPFYQQFFESPVQDAFMFPIEQYVRCMTSGTMGRPKWYLVPNSSFEDASLTLLAALAAASHDGSKVTLAEGDTCYALLAPKPFITGHFFEFFMNKYSNIIRCIPTDQSISFMDKITLFMKELRNIQVVFMPFVIMWNVVYPQVRSPFKLKGLMTMDNSSILYKEKIMEMNGVRPTAGYASTETGLASVPSVEHELGFMFDWRSIFCEFIPEDRAILEERSLTEGKDTITMGEVKTAERYQLVATPLRNEITRFVMMDLLECIAKGDNILGTDLPVFKFVGRVGGVISLHNFTRIDENEIVKALNGAGVKYVDFTARVEVEEAKEHIVLYVELSGEESASEVGKTVHDELSNMDADYRNLTQFFRYVPLKVATLPRRTFETYLGERKGMVKPERLGMKEENFQALMQIAKSMSKA